MIPEIFEVCKGEFKSKRLRSLCTLRPVSLEEDDDEDEDESDSESNSTAPTPDKDDETPEKDVPANIEMV